MKIGDKFYAIVKRGQHSKTLEGIEAAGRKIGPFTATKVTKNQIEARDTGFVRQFLFRDFDISGPLGF